MGESLSGWLALRERADADARSSTLTAAVAERLRRDRPLGIVDLATGTGSNIRYLAPRLAGAQQWLAIDRDAALLAEVPARLNGSDGFAVGVETRAMELGTLPAEIFAGRDLVTASALLDLVSVRWIEQLVARCREAGASALFALSYDGRSECDPSEPEDEEIREWFNRHQQASDKGLGRAGGPGAAAAARARFAAAGYVVRHERSDWVLAPDQRQLQRELIEGWAAAVSELQPDRSAWIASWRSRRLAHVDAGRSRIVVGHEDLAAWLDT